MARRKRSVRMGRLVFVMAVFGMMFLAVLYGGYRVTKVLRSGGSFKDILGDTTARAYPLNHSQEVQAIKEGKVLDKVSVTGFSDDDLRSLFYTQPLTDAQIEAMQDKTLSSTYNYTTADNLSCVRVLYRDFHGDSRIGELAIDSSLAQEMADIFYNLYLHQYPIGKMTLADTYGGSEKENMDANNTFGLLIDDPSDPDHNALNTGFAVYINPLYNPKVLEYNTTTQVIPDAAYPYSNRSTQKKYMINDKDYAYQLFTSKGYRWGGDAGAPSYGLFWKDYPKSQKKGNDASSSTTQDAQSSTPTAPAGESNMTPGAQPDSSAQPPLDGSQTPADTPTAPETPGKEEIPDGSAPVNPETPDNPQDPNIPTVPGEDQTLPGNPEEETPDTPWPDTPDDGQTPGLPDENPEDAPVWQDGGTQAHTDPEP